jgi:hypothetical protein
VSVVTMVIDWASVGGLNWKRLKYLTFEVPVVSTL